MHTVNDIKQTEAKGPWQSKSGGSLDVLFALSETETQQFLDYKNPEFDTIKQATGINIRGLRSYTVSNIAKGSIGAKEWHKARSEYLYAPMGSATVHCVDLAGNEKTFTVSPQQAIIIPPTILHTYTALEDNTKLQVICNTLFIPEEPETHDSFLSDEFYQLARGTDASSH